MRCGGKQAPRLVRELAKLAQKKNGPSEGGNARAVLPVGAVARLRSRDAYERPTLCGRFIDCR
jgi:hypothetical protein